MAMDEQDREKSGGFLSRASAFLKGGKGTKVIVALGLAGMGLILLSNFWPAKSGSQPKTAQLTAEEFTVQLEKKLTELVGSLEGAGESKVMVTLENGVEYVYATQDKVNTNEVQDTDGDSNKLTQQNDSEKEIIVVDTENGRQGLLVTEIQPTVKGVVIVCEGGDNAAVQQRITQAITTALNLSSSRVCVTKAS